MINYDQPLRSEPPLHDWEYERAMSCAENDSPKCHRCDEWAPDPETPDDTGPLPLCRECSALVVGFCGGCGTAQLQDPGTAWTLDDADDPGRRLYGCPEGGCAGALLVDVDDTGETVTVWE